DRSTALVPEFDLGPIGKREDLWRVGPILEFPIPLFDQGQARSAEPRRSFAGRNLNTMLLGSEFARPRGSCVTDWRQPGIGYCITETLYCRYESGSSTKHNCNTTRCSSVHFNSYVPRSSRLKPLWAT